MRHSTKKALPPTRTGEPPARPWLAEPAQTKARPRRSGLALTLTLALAPLLCPAAALADDDAHHAAREPGIFAHATIQNLLVYQNDRDFDRSEALYEPDGQSVGALTTTLEPGVVWQVSPDVGIVYEAELGVNVWSNHDPDQEDTTQTDALVLRHRELFTEGHIPRLGLGFKVGYQRLSDATELFVGHYVGAARLSLDIGNRADITVAVAQSPDPTYESVHFGETNFVNDTMIYGLEGACHLDDIDLTVGVWTLDDNHEVGRENLVVNPLVALDADLDPVNIDFGAALQVGRFTGNALGGNDQSHLAWATQLGVGLEISSLTLRLGLLALSPDDDSSANDNFAFTYSGRSASPTRTLTEDELRDRHHALDERVGVNLGGFFLARPGLLVTDLSATIEATEWFEPMVVVAYGRVLEPANTLDEATLGVEALVDLTFDYDDLVFFDLVGGVFAPGGAAAAVANEIDRTATETQLLVEAALTVSY